MTIRHDHPVAMSAARGFTLTELIVAIGATLLLVVGIGQIYTSVNRLVTTGAAVAEIDQLARSIEQQMREDFASLKNLRAEDTFLAIRSRKIGDVNNNGMLDRDERAIYVTREDREADARAGIAPYERDGDDNPRGRAVTRRLDEIMFLSAAGSGGEFLSRQTPPSAADPPTRALAARIYYGHGLRPAPDTDSPYYTERESVTADPRERNPNRPLAPRRRWIPDGDFGQRTGESNETWGRFWNFNGGRVTGRNEYAGDWMLLRQPLLLTGGYDAAGPRYEPGASRRSTPEDSGIRYAPYIRDLESITRFGNLREPTDDTFPPPFPGPDVGWAIADGGDQVPPFPRAIKFGRVDVCAQTLEDVRRWFEGMQEFGPIPPVDASPFSSGRWNGGTGTPGLQNDADRNGVPDLDAAADAPLWLRAPRSIEPSGYSYGWNPLQPITLRADSLIFLQSAIAGCFSRLLAESEPPFFDRRQHDQEAMDTHAVLAMRCSNFEVAWSDGTTWPDRTNTHGDGASMDRPFIPTGRPDIKLYYGDVVWFDAEFTRAEARRQVQLRNALQPLYSAVDADSTSSYAGPDPEIIPPRGFIRTASAIGRSSNERLIRLLFPDTSGASFGDPATWGAYDVRDTKGAPSDPAAAATGGNPYANPAQAGEYLAVWGFREPVTEDDPRFLTSPQPRPQQAAFGGAWKKPLMVRIRMTLHDSQFRIPGGRTFEFVFYIDLQGN